MFYKANGVDEDMKISVAMCTYNGGKYLEDQLSSIINQIRLPDEMVICDDASHDCTLDILQTFAEHAPFETHICRNVKTLGTIRNFEKAISLCSGDIIVLADQDDYWYQHKLDSIEHFFSYNPDVGGVFSNADIVDHNLNPYGYCLWDVIHFTKKEQTFIQNGSAINVLLKHPVVTGATMAFRSSWLDYFTSIPTCWMHDAWIALNLAVLSDISLIHDELIQYRQHADNQIGGRHKGIFFRIKETLSTDREAYYSIELERYHIAYDHFSKWLLPNHKNMILLSNKINHLKARKSMPAQKHLRIPIILKEIIRGNYQRYSVNWQVAAKDFLLPP